MTRYIKMLAIAVGLPAMEAQGNDSVAGLALGGLEFLRTDAVEMVSEDLLIRPDLVQVRYVFRNVTNESVETLVAFPLPGVGFPRDDIGYVPLPIDDSENYVGFSTRIDGTTLVPQVETRALLLGLDRTEVLRALKIPLVPFHWTAPDTIAALPEATRDILRREMLISAINEPLWTLQTTYYRHQTFPPGTDVVVEHEYRPVAGGSVLAPVGNWGLPRDTGDPELAWIDDERARFCVEPVVEDQMERQRLGGGRWPEHMFTSTDVEYILTTGGNWRGPIGTFRLVIESPGPADFVFACFEGARRVAPNRIEAEIEGFWPWTDLHILFARAHGDGMPPIE